MKQTTVICLWGGPGSGKSTTAAEVYAALKKQLKSVELVREYVKGWAWEGRRINWYDEWYFLGKRLRSEAVLYGKVDYIVTDSPFLIGAVYADHYTSDKAVREATIAAYRSAQASGVVFKHYLIDRTKPYLQDGRFESEDTARKFDTLCRDFLESIEADYVLDTTDGIVGDFT